jgi:hypothetical protein
MTGNRPVLVADLSGTLIRARPPLFGAATPSDFFTAYENAFGRPFPAGLLPDAALRVLGDRGGRRFAREEAAALRNVELPPRRTDRVQLLIGARGAAKYWLGKFDLLRFTRDCPLGYFLVGFDRHAYGLLRFYYMRRDEWSRVLFRLPCRGSGLYDGRSVAQIPDFLEKFAAFTRAVRPHATVLVACEKSVGWIGSSYKITMVDGTIRTCDRSQFCDTDFSALTAQMQRG